MKSGQRCSNCTVYLEKKIIFSKYLHNSFSTWDLCHCVRGGLCDTFNKVTRAKFFNLNDLNRIPWSELIPAPALSVFIKKIKVFQIRCSFFLQKSSERNFCVRWTLVITINSFVLSITHESWPNRTLRDMQIRNRNDCYFFSRYIFFRFKHETLY